MNPDLTTVDLFAGAGGLSLGFHDAGFHPCLGTDFDSAAARTFQANLHDVPFIEAPIESLSAQDILDTTGLRYGELGVLLGGPPCQAFSVYNHQRGFHDERSGLFREYLRLVEGLMPRTLVIENVVGMTSLGNGRAVEEIHRELNELGFCVEHRILEAERFGIPQERRRIFFLASRVGPVAWPDSKYCGKLKKPEVTVGDAIFDLPPLGIGDGSDDVVPYASGPSSQYQHRMRNGSVGVVNHVAPTLGNINIRRMKHIPQGGSWRDVPFALLPAGMKRAKRSDHTKRYGRLHPDGLASTILTKCDLHWGAYIHPTQDRTLTVREASRFQSFPDCFRFTGPRSEQYKQVGNAVPPMLAQAVADSVLRMLASSAVEGVHAS